MRGISFKAVALATIATLGLDILSGIALMVVLGGDPAAQGMTEQQSREALKTLTATQSFLVPGFVLGTLTTVLGGYVAARIAKSVPYMNALAFGLLGIVIGAFTVEGLPLWYKVLGFSATLPAALLGGHIAKQQMKGAA